MLSRYLEIVIILDTLIIKKIVKNSEKIQNIVIHIL